VTGFVEGAGLTEGLVNAGVYAVSPEIMRFIPQSGFADFGRDVFPAMLAQGAPIGAYALPEGGFCLGLDTPESYAAGEALLNEGRIRL
jgi:NDP-sugar pyrophosphorylase family protein